ncbi:hypothetical protein HAX54_039962, partial [Datura stramonium]|nr:hypothetical protein [Datura stramonium]
KGKAKGGMDNIDKYFSPSVPPFAKWIAQQALDPKIANHIERLKEATLRVPFNDTIKEILGFAKYLNVLLTRKLPCDKKS